MFYVVFSIFRVAAISAIDYCRVQSHWYIWEGYVCAYVLRMFVI